MTLQGITAGNKPSKDEKGKPIAVPIVSLRFTGEGCALNLNGLTPEEVKGIGYGSEVSVTIK